MSKRWVGLSTDVKPTLSWSNNSFRGLDHGDEFYEQDTGATYIYHNGLDSWSLKPNLVRPMVWDTTSLSYVAQTQTSIVTGSLTVAGEMDLTKIGGAVVGATNALHVQPGTAATFPVSGTFWPGTQPVSGTVTAGIDQTTVGTTDSVTVKKTSLTGSAPAAVSVGIASAEAVAANANRKGLLLVNTSANYISLAFGAAAVLYSGITLNPSGGAFWMDEYSFTTAQVRAIASGAASNMAVQELA